jgi:hypothetical protein
VDQESHAWWQARSHACEDVPDLIVRKGQDVDDHRPALWQHGTPDLDGDAAAKVG